MLIRQTFTTCELVAQAYVMEILMITIIQNQTDSDNLRTMLKACPHTFSSTQGHLPFHHTSSGYDFSGLSSLTISGHYTLIMMLYQIFYQNLV